MRTVNPCAVTRLYNCYPTDILPKLDKVGRMNYSLVFTTEDEKTVADRIDAVKSERRDALKGTTRGYFNR